MIQETTQIKINEKGSWSGWEQNFELACKAIPIENILEVIQFLQYAHPLRVYIQFLFLTGCRVSEASKMEFEGKDSFIKGNYVFWKVGKNQGGQWRREYLPEFFLKELADYKKQTKGMQGRLFHTEAKTMSSYFTKFIRPHLSEAWQEKAAVPHGVAIEHILGLKCFRKTFSTLCFWGFWSEYKDANIAMVLTCKRMKHSTTGMTINHYIDQSKRLNREKWEGSTPSQILALAVQRSLTDFKHDPFTMKLVIENQQTRIQQF